MTSERVEYGIVLGRFQPFHLGHVEYLEAARSLSRRLVVGITNPDPGSTSEEAADPRRSRKESNPFSYFERMLMIEASLLDAGWLPREFIFAPAPINVPERLPFYLPPPQISTFFVTVYDEWGDTKRDRLEHLGYQTEVLWRRSHDDRLTSGEYLRSAMTSGAGWRHLVPGAVVRFLQERGHIPRVHGESNETA